MMKKRCVWAMALAVAAPGGVSQAQAQRGVDAASVPVLSWAPCEPGETLQCATATVPLDYDSPEAGTIDLALLRRPAGDPTRRIGTLFMNPGGPGASGVDAVRYEAELNFPAEVLERFDVLGFDPRFVADSQGAACTTEDEYYELLNLPAVPRNADEERLIAETFARYTEQCAQRRPDIQYAATANVARDMELLRRAVGDERLTYAGFSYGSILGQTYAALFPERVRAMWIDGVADAQAWSGTEGDTTSNFKSRTAGALGTHETLQEFLRICAQSGPDRCKFARHGDLASAFSELAAAMKAGPLKGTDESIDYSYLISLTAGSLYSPLNWALLAEHLDVLWQYAFEGLGSEPAMQARLSELDAELQARMGERALPPLRQLRRLDDMSIDTLTATYAVRCADSINSRDVTDWARAAAEDEQRWPYFGGYWVWEGIACASWSLPAPGRYTGPFDLATSAPVLVSNTRFDPATPLAGAQVVADRLPGARLLVLEAAGHVSTLHKSRCMSDAVTSYLVDGTLPAPGTVCNAETEYFPSR